MLSFNLPIIQNPEQRITADFIVSICADRGFGIPHQAAGVDQADLTPMECGVLELMSVSEDDQIGIPDPGAACQQGDIRDIIFFAVGHQNAVPDIGWPFKCMLWKRETNGQFICFRREKSGEDGRQEACPGESLYAVSIGDSIVGECGNIADRQPIRFIRRIR